MSRFTRALSVIGVAALIAAVLPMSTASAGPLNPPSAPRQVAVGNPTAVSLDVSWAAPQSNGGSSVTDYTVSYRKQGDLSWSVFAHTASTATSRTVTGLAGNTNYEFRIAAVNINGTGPWSTTKTQLWLGRDGACARTAAGPSQCWGNGLNVGPGGNSQNTPSALASLDGPGNRSWVDLALLSNGGCAILSDGSTVCWGQNYSGELGNGSVSNINNWEPAQVSGLDGTSPATTAISIDAWAATTCAIMANGTAKCWGEGWSGQLGNNSAANSPVPVPVSGFDGLTAATTPVQISLGLASACAVLADASAMCWGNGAIGDGSTNTMRSVPTAVSGLDGSTSAASAVSIQTSAGHACALLENKSVRCWGYNRDGQGGDGTTTLFRSTPVQAVGLDGTTAASSVESLTTFNNGGCVSMTDKSTKCWGSLLSWRPAILTPTVVPMLDGTSSAKTALALSASDDFNCALIADGSTKCWGYNEWGNLGDGTNSSSEAPVSVLDAPGILAQTSPPLGAISHLVTSNATSSSVSMSWAAPRETGGFPITNNRVRYRKLGALSWTEFVHPLSTSTAITVTGLLPETSYEFQVAAVNVLGTGPWASDYVAVSAGSGSSCAVTSDGSAECWGANDHGALGNGALDSSRTPVSVVGVDGSDTASTAVSIGSGGAYSCAQMANHTVKCWGQNQNGQLGNGSNMDSSTPVGVIGLGEDPPTSSIGIGSSHACAVVEEGDYATVCWGKNDHGQLGDGGTSSQSTPLEVLQGEGYFDHVAAGGSFSCATEYSYNVKCWGANDVGQLGDGTTTNGPQGVYVPVFDASSDDTTPINVTSAGSTACVISFAGTVWCWGYGLKGGLGNGASQNSSVPVRVTGIDGLTSQTTAKQIASGGEFSCAVTNAGAVKCWGANDQGQLGNNLTANSATPVTVSGLDGSTLARSATSVAVSVSGFACATLAVGGLACWGDNSSGQLGDGTIIDRRTPVGVVRAVATTLSVTSSTTAPSAPRNFAVSVRLAETIGLAWDAPASNGGARITGYEVRWARGNQQAAAANLLEVPGTQFSARVAGLLPGITYTFFVRAVNSVGTGPTARITAIVPVEAPAPVVTKTAWSNRKITLTWLGVKTPAHSPVLDYVLTCEAADVTFRQTVGANARSASVVVDSDRRHGCRVVARTDAGRGAGSDRVIVSPNSQG